MSQVGGDVAQLRELRAAFERQAGSVTELLGTLKKQLTNTFWQGPAADRFRQSWEQEYEPSLRKLEGSLKEAGGEAGRRADALEQAGS